MNKRNQEGDWIKAAIWGYRIAVFLVLTIPFVVGIIITLVTLKICGVL